MHKMNRFKISHTSLLLLSNLAVLLIGCNDNSRAGDSKKAVELLIEFVVSGDTTQLQEVFADSVLDEMSIEDMIKTREDMLTRFGKLHSVGEAEFTTDSTAEVKLNYEQLNLLASLSFDSTGKISFVSISPAAIENNITIDDDSKLTDIDDFEGFRSAFNSDSEYVRLVSILSPT